MLLLLIRLRLELVSSSELRVVLIRMLVFEYVLAIHICFRITWIGIARWELEHPFICSLYRLHCHIIVATDDRMCRPLWMVLRMRLSLDVVRNMRSSISLVVDRPPVLLWMMMLFHLKALEEILLNGTLLLGLYCASK